MTALLRQIAAVIRDHGPLRAIAVLAARAKNQVVDSGDVIWFVKGPVTPDTFRTDHAPFELREAVDDADLAELDRLRPLAPDVRALRESAGGRRWVLRERDGGELVYTGWTYTREAIISERPPVKLPLPAGTWQLEDSYVPRSRRGALGAAVGIESIGERYLIDHGEPLMLLTKIDVENLPAIKAVEHGNWRRFAVAHGRKVIGRPTRWRIEIERDEFPALRSLERGGR